MAMNPVNSIASATAAQAAARAAAASMAAAAKAAAAQAASGGANTWAAQAPSPKTNVPEVTPPEALRTATPKNMQVVDFSQPKAASLEAPMDKIVDVALHGNNEIGTLSQLRNNEPEFLTLITLVMRNSGGEMAATRSYSRHAAAQIANPGLTGPAPVGENVDLAA